MPSASFVAAVAASIGTPPSSGNITSVGARNLITVSTYKFLTRAYLLSCFPLYAQGKAGGYMKMGPSTLAEITGRFSFYYR